MFQSAVLVLLVLEFLTFWSALEVHATGINFQYITDKNSQIIFFVIKNRYIKEENIATTQGITSMLQETCTHSKPDAFLFDQYLIKCDQYLY